MKHAEYNTKLNTSTNFIHKENPQIKHTVDNSNNFIADVRRSISELGRSGLTFDWDKMKINEEYFINRDDIMSMDMLWFLNKQKILKRAKELNADVVMFEDLIKDRWVIKLQQYYV